MRVHADVHGHVILHRIADAYNAWQDDFIFCPHAMRALDYIIAKAHAYQP